ncbi:MAG: VOC family protein [Sphingobacteriales bacterium]|nr:VOC family protein [Sphingobacteriales bacterium]MBI3720221.1 VOC family protein [Sphingobacteriales bacterium]
MKNVIDKMLDSYEKGGISRRDFVQSLAVIAATPSLLTQTAQTTFQGTMLNHATIHVADVAKSKAFYQNLLGLKVRDEDKDYCNLDLGNSFLSINKDEGPSGIDHFCIGIESFNAEAVFEKLKKEFPSANPTMEYGNQVYLHDPDNIRFQLSAKDYRG